MTALLVLIASRLRQTLIICSNEFSKMAFVRRKLLDHLFRNNHLSLHREAYRLPAYPKRAPLKLINPNDCGFISADFLGAVWLFDVLEDKQHRVDLLTPIRDDWRYLEQQADLYLVGSPEANDLTRVFLGELQKDKTLDNCWRFERLYGKNIYDHWKFTPALVRGNKRYHRSVAPPEYRLPSNRDEYDYGLLVRAPHPAYRKRVVVIMAGPHGWGTLAACVAATDTKLTSRMIEIAGASEENPAVWALLKVMVNPDSQHTTIAADQITIEEAVTLLPT